MLIFSTWFSFTEYNHNIHRFIIGRTTYRIISPFEYCLLAITKIQIDEGINLETDLVLHVELILNALIEVEHLDPSRMEQQRSKMFNDLKAFVTEEEIDNNRFEQELIFYFEKWILPKK